LTSVGTDEGELPTVGGEITSPQGLLRGASIAGRVRLAGE
jgi:hypothetical protein